MRNSELKVRIGRKSLFSGGSMVPPETLFKKIFSGIA
jgi:hypothetical protein